MTSLTIDVRGSQACMPLTTTAPGKARGLPGAAARRQSASVFLVSEAAAVARSLIFEAKSSTWNV